MKSQNQKSQIETQFYIIGMSLGFILKLLPISIRQISFEILANEQKLPFQYISSNNEENKVQNTNLKVKAAIKIAYVNLFLKFINFLSEKDKSRLNMIS